MAWMRRWLPDDDSVQIINRGDEYVGLALWGANARAVLEKVTHHDVSNDAFPYYTVQQIGVGMAPVIALRLSYVGELGWELYTPNNFGLHLYNTLWEAGREFDMPACGIGSVLSARLEKGYRLFGADITPEVNAYEAGLAGLLRYNKGDFIGRDASLRFKEKGVARQLVCLTFDDRKAVMFGNEPVLSGDQVIGRITSGNYGYAVGKFIAFAFVPNDFATIGTRVRVRYAGNFFEGVVSDPVLYDPRNERMRA
jgi:glycine cleavage system aminomethyltransferase T